MISSIFNRMGGDPHYEFDVIFKLIDSKSGSIISPDTIKINDVTKDFVYKNGYITVSVPTTGMFTLSIDKENYNSLIEKFSYATLYNSSQSLTKIQGTGECEAKVKWNHEAIGDLDSHLQIYNGDNKLGEVFYSSKTYTNDNTKVVLDLDDTGSNDGETTTINPVYDSYKYVFVMIDFRNRSSTTVNNLSKSAPVCTITFNNKSYTIKAPSDTIGSFWNVFSIENGTLTVLNTITTANEYAVRT